MQNYTIDTETLCQDVKNLKGKKVLILGDVMLDVYLEGSAKRISPEAPVPIVHVNKQKNMLGGGANVAHNIRTLGGLPTLISLCGTGRDGQSLMRLLQESYIAAHIFQNDKRCTTVKTRVMAKNQQMLRVDKEDYIPNSDDENIHLGHALEALLPLHNVLVLSDYAKGLINSTVTENIKQICSLSHMDLEIYVDPKPQNADIYCPVALMTPNRNEASVMANMSIESQEDVLRAGRYIIGKYNCNQLLMTLGSEGMALFLQDGSVLNIASPARSVFDVTGAGDTVIATLALAKAAEIPLVNACILATYAANLVLEHVGVACVQLEDLFSAVRNNQTPTIRQWA